MAPVYTNTNGCPVPDPMASQRIGKHGPLLLQDFNFIDSIAHFDRERIPERVVHAKGSGAYGVFEVTDDISDICSSKFLDTVGKKTKVVTRFSTVGGESGSADTARDPRGFSVKFYTEEGNLDFVYNNTPVFFLRDPTKFPHFIHTQKRHPQTHLKDANMFWDYLCSNEESAHQVMILFSDRGTPRSYREMHGYSGHTYKWSTKNGDWHYVQVHLKSDQGFKTLTNEEAGALAGSNPDYAQEDLFKEIAKGNHPSWTCYIQTMTAEQAKHVDFSVFDLTKVWPQKDFPLRRFGKITLNENPKNYFAEVEQVAFSPSHSVPYMEPSADPVLQSRLFSYPDTHRHRLGTNYQQIPVNCPVTGAFHPHIRDGAMLVNGNMGSTPNYYSAANNFATERFSLQEDQEVWEGAACPFHWKATDAEFKQATDLWHVLARTPGQQENLAHNVVAHASAADVPIQDRVVAYFTKVHPDLGQAIKKGLEESRK
ncbi:peroxisomal catalase [Metschnikowia bicuspidata var. bicuspidata NRRL YB-4993]|uniref:Catalase n=1 Tax=Metschnikowia bicuspidata var. bicuspidata NRRL YB-4993 TaxID=869754 RepID=A0A1A0HE26_9ASCO|nr:peroxisomal catalase [Metschnikowia bicuspidata var. bicuspidata NRRL YB-4993]OBA22354.1 peroxisomal catalase [Metschnikowia bicuspidata var. bicuspidata NRRL YB-4993]